MNPADRKLGVCYHLWPDQNRWRDDLARMADLGLNFVRADWAWQEIEPLPYVRRAGILERFLDIAGENGLQVLFCHTAARSGVNTPFWLRPFIRNWKMVDSTGEELDGDWPSFHHHTYYHRLGQTIQAVVRSVRGHPALFGHQPMNEPHQPQFPMTDYHPTALREYFDLTGVQPPREPRNPESPGWNDWLRWRRWQAEAMADAVDRLSARIRTGDPSAKIVVAEMPWWWWGELSATIVDPERIYRSGDILGIDIYPENSFDANYITLSVDYLQRVWSRPVWLTEVNRKDGNPEPDDLAAFALAGAKAGAEAYLHFAWRDDDRDGGRYGLFDAAGGARPALEAFKAAIDVWKRTPTDDAVPGDLLEWPEQSWAHGSDCMATGELYSEACRLMSEGKRVGISPTGRVPTALEKAPT